MLVMYLFSRGPNLPPEWKTEIDPNIVRSKQSSIQSSTCRWYWCKTTLYIDQSGISFDATNNRLGINSTAPEYTLDVQR